MVRLTKDNLFKMLTAAIAASAVIILVITAYTLITGSGLVLQRFGTNFVFGTAWNPVEGREAFGALPYI